MSVPNRFAIFAPKSDHCLLDHVPSAGPDKSAAEAEHLRLLRGNVDFIVLTPTWTGARPATSASAPPGPRAMLDG